MNVTLSQSSNSIDNVRKKVFGTKLEAGWKEAIRDFPYAYKQIPNITKPLKVHIVIAHVCDFIEKFGNGRGLGSIRNKLLKLCTRNLKQYFLNTASKTYILRYMDKNFTRL